jgi:hypothetical protein
MLAATATEFAEFQAVGRGLLVLGRYVIPALACLTLKHNVIARHNSPIPASFPICWFCTLLSSLYFAVYLALKDAN